MLRDELIKEISKAVGADVDIKLAEPERSENGDYSTNVAFRVAGDPEAIAAELRKSKLIKDVEVKNKFINIFLKDDVLIKELGRELKCEKKNKKINVEFVSANPTGPLTMANGRGGFYGDALSNILEKSGYGVTREYYVNDSGNQVRLLGESIEAAQGKIPDREEYYKGEYIKTLAGHSREEAVRALLDDIKISLHNAHIEFDSWFSENDGLRTSGAIEETLRILESKDCVEKRDGAVWLGDRVLVKSDGEPTYLLADLAYHRNKLIERNFDKAVTIVGDRKSTRLNS